MTEYDDQQEPDQQEPDYQEPERQEPDKFDSIMKELREEMQEMTKTKSLFEKERVFYTRMSPRGKRSMTIFFDDLTPEQRAKIDEVEAFLLEVAEDASDETRTALKTKGGTDGIRGIEALGGSERSE